MGWTKKDLEDEDTIYSKKKDTYFKVVLDNNGSTVCVDVYTKNLELENDYLYRETYFIPEILREYLIIHED